MKRKLAIAAVFAAWFGSPAAAEPLTVLTEPYPAYTYMRGDEIVGAGADQVHAMMKRAGIAYEMHMLPWARAYQMATRDPMTCIFAAAHTHERDKLFKWVEPLGGGKVLLIRRAGSGVSPRTVDEAKNYIVGVQRGDYAADYLTKQGFTKLDLASDFGLTLKKLISGRIDLAMTSEAAYRAELAKGQPLEEVLSMPTAIYALACSLDVPDATIRALQKELDQIVLSGEQDRIYVQHGMPEQRFQSLIKKTD